MIVFNDFSIIAWNVQGFSNKRRYHHMKELLRRFKPDLVFVFEPHVQFARCKGFLGQAKI